MTLSDIGARLFFTIRQDENGQMFIARNYVCPQMIGSLEHTLPLFKKKVLLPFQALAIDHAHSKQGSWRTDRFMVLFIRLPNYLDIKA